MLELLDEVAAHPERWKDVRMKQLGDRRWRREVPHPARRDRPRSRSRSIVGSPAESRQARAARTAANGRRRTAVSLESKAMGRWTR